MVTQFFTFVYEGWVGTLTFVYVNIFSLCKLDVSDYSLLHTLLYISSNNMLKVEIDLNEQK